MAKKAPVKKAKPKTLEHNTRLCAAISYIIFGIIWFFADPKMRKDAFVKFHVTQAFVLLITWAIINVASWLLPFFFFGWIFMILHLCLFVLLIIGIINALDSKKKELPIIGQFAKSLRF